MPSGVNEGDYLPNTVIFKVKSQYRQNFNANAIENIPDLQDFLHSIGAQNLARIFPHQEAPKEARNMLGQKLVDLSLIYSFEYTSERFLEQVINDMLSLGYFEYVEPSYVPKIFAAYSPDDPCWVSTCNGSPQFHLKGTGVLGTGSINAPNAWGITKGDTSVVIGLVDTGTELKHPDLAGNVYQWVGETGLDSLGHDKRFNRIDDDHDGYIDNYNGWDVAMNDSDVTWDAPVSSNGQHGVATSGDACAVTGNDTGVASPGFKCKFFMVKIMNSSGAIITPYTGIVYAADHGAKIISNSWGGPFSQSYGQDVVDYAAINKNCLVIAAAGNGSSDVLDYPSSYNHVYRVAASTSTDTRSLYSNYGLDIDYSAPGENIYSTDLNGSYNSNTGTSMSCPISAGAAGIVQSYFHYPIAFQIGEKLKQTCTPMTQDAQYTAGKMGKGRIDMFHALTQAAKSILVDPVTVKDKNNSTFMAADTLNISGIFTSYLDPSSSAATAVLSVVSGPATVISGNFNIGVLGTLKTDSNTRTPFTVRINTNAVLNQDIQFKIQITDSAFSGDTYFDILVGGNTGQAGVNNIETENFRMYCYPNPATDLVTINYNIATGKNASLRMMSLLGEEVINMENIPAGKNNLTIDVSKFSPGIYFYQLRSGETSLTKKMMVF